MTPKQEAKELVEKFMNVRWDISPDEAKIMSLICNQREFDLVVRLTNDSIIPLKYGNKLCDELIEVKKEIEQL